VGESIISVRRSAVSITVEVKRPPASDGPPVFMLMAGWRVSKEELLDMASRYLNDAEHAEVAEALGLPRPG
jgi:hypothetical protein